MSDYCCLHPSVELYPDGDCEWCLVLWRGNMFEQADRLPDDGGIAVHRADDDYIIIECDGHAVRCSEFNASRIFAGLSMMLGIPLSNAVMKAIHLGDISGTKVGRITVEMKR